jgi:hypothetical protein
MSKTIFLEEFTVPFGPYGTDLDHFWDIDKSNLGLAKILKLGSPGTGTGTGSIIPLGTSDRTSTLSQRPEQST